MSPAGWNDNRRFGLTTAFERLATLHFVIFGLEVESRSLYGCTNGT